MIVVADEVLLKVGACGVCGSDIARVMEKGTYKMPMIPGHEFSGEVVELGESVSIQTRPGEGISVGCRVAVMPLIPCRRCQYCQIGKYNLCEDYSYYGSRQDGAFAEFVAVKHENLVKLPEGVSFEAAACCDPAAVSLHGLLRGAISPDDTVAVLGVGAIGLFVIQLSKLLGAQRTIAVDILDEKLELAKELSADFLINSSKQDLLEAIKGEYIKLVVECAGVKETRAQAILLASKLGRVVYIGDTKCEVAFSSAAFDKILRGELTIYGSWNSSFTKLPVDEWQTVLNYMAAGKLKVEPIISHKLPIEDAPSVFKRLYERSEFFSKVLFVF